MDIMGTIITAATLKRVKAVTKITDTLESVGVNHDSAKKVAEIATPGKAVGLIMFLHLLKH